MIPGHSLLGRIPRIFVQLQCNPHGPGLLCSLPVLRRWFQETYFMIQTWGSLLSACRYVPRYSLAADSGYTCNAAKHGNPMASMCTSTTKVTGAHFMLQSKGTSWTSPGQGQATYVIVPQDWALPLLRATTIPANKWDQLCWDTSWKSWSHNKNNICLCLLRQWLSSSGHDPNQGCGGVRPLLCLSHLQGSPSVWSVWLSLLLPAMIPAQPGLCWHHWAWVGGRDGGRGCNLDLASQQEKVGSHRSKALIFLGLPMGGEPTHTFFLAKTAQLESHFAPGKSLSHLSQTQ